MTTTTQLSKVCSLADAIRQIGEGNVVALGGRAGHGYPMAAVREIVRQRKRGLHLVGCNNGIDIDMLVGAGCATTVETANVGIGGRGPAGNVERASAAGAVRLIEHSEATVIGRFHAASLGLPMLPIKAFADLRRSNSHLKSLKDPFGGEALFAIEAIRPDVAIVHAHAADSAGNVRWEADGGGELSDDAMIARSAKAVIVTVEQIVSDEAVRRTSGAMLPAANVSWVVEAPYGAHPCGCGARYDEDFAHLGRYGAAAASPAEFEGWLAEFVTSLEDHWAYLDKVGSRRLMEISGKRTAFA